MKKLWIPSLALSVILLLFFIPILLKQAPELTKVDEDYIGKSCPIEITIIGLDMPLPLEEYVKGVIAAEMPISFHDEALKAQAIAARTYALKITENGKKPIAADVSAQVFYSKAQRKERWGKEFNRNERKITAAVKATSGDIIVYGDEMISAMFFSTSNGRTETARNYGGNDIPYLQSVESPGEEIAPSFNRKKEMTLSEWNEALNIQWDESKFKSLQLVRNSTGRVQRAISDGFDITGRQMREALGLASTDFDIAYDVTNKIVHVETTGYGHGVGMSQYGAEVLAQKEWTAEQILLYYYTGTTIKKFSIPGIECLKTP